MLTDYLNQDTMQVKVKIRDWQEAGKIAGNILVKTGSIDTAYVQAMLDNVIEQGPYIVIAPGIALFHARPEDGVNSIGLSLITLKDGVNFHAGKKDPVKLVFVLAAIDNNAHLDLLSDLTRLLRNKETHEKMMNADSIEELVKLIENFETDKEEK